MKKAKSAKIGVISALAATAVCGSAFAVSQLAVEKTSAEIPVNDSSVAISERGQLNIQTASLSTVQSGWTQAVQTSISSGAQVTFKLTENWLNTILGTGAGFKDGALYVPDGADIKLDLNGKKISRNLTAARAGGNIITVEGKLEICDTSAAKRGAVTGAYSETYGAVYVDGGSLIITDANINGNRAKNGGGVYLDNGASMIMNGGSLSENVTESAGAAVYMGKNTSFVLNSGVLDKNQAPTNGASGVYLSADSKAYFEMNGGVISNGKASSGGGVYVDDGLFKMTGGEITGNTCGGWGGGVAVCESGSADCDSKFIMEGGKITDNTASNGGAVAVYENCEFEMNGGEISGNTGNSYSAGVFLSGAVFTMTEGAIKDNKSLYGGAVYVGDIDSNGVKSAFKMTGGEITGNGHIGTGDNGGGVTVASGAFTMDGGVIGGNSAHTASGGGVCVYDRFIFNGGEISNNSAINGGAIMAYGEDCYFEMNGGVISENSVSQNGAAIYVSQKPTVIINGGEIKNNKTVGQGAVYILEGSEVTMNGGVITGNTSTNGGGVNVLQGKFTLNNGKITENITTGSYGGAGVVVNSSGTFIMKDGEISGNEATGNGGGVYLTEGAIVVIDGGEISDNEATGNGGGIYCYRSNLTINGSTITNNTSGTLGSGVYITEANSVFNLGGGYIYGNKNTSGENKNVQLKASNVIKVTGNLTNKAYVGITSDNNIVTSGYISNGNAADKINDYFFADSPNKTLSLADGEIVQTDASVAKTYISWKYSHNGGSATYVSNTAFEVSAEYTGGFYTFSADGISFSAYDEDENRVGSFSKVGKYRITAADASNYYNPVLSFEITPADISGAAVNAESAVYCGGALTPAVSVELNGKRLKKDVDYTVSYKNNIYAGSGVAVITGKGNYAGAAEGTFVIEKAVLGVRLGETNVEYNGKVQGVQVFLEGLIGDDKAEVTVTYTKDGAPVANPVDAGTYIAVITIDHPNYKFSAVKEKYFTVNPKKLSVIWSGGNFAYDGREHFPSAHIVTVDGLRVDLDVTHPNSVAAGDYTASVSALPSGYENYVITSNRAKDYKIVKSGLQAVWAEANFTYDGAQKLLGATLTDGSGADITSLLTFEYFDKDGNQVTPVNAGEYTVRITLNHADYTLTGDTEVTYTIKKAKANISVGGFDGTFTGTGLSPLQSVTDVNGADLPYRATYAECDSLGNPITEFSETLPVNTGRYILKVEIDDENYETEGGEYFTEVYEVEAKEISVVWSGDGRSMFDGGIYYWLYDGTAHAPSATADGIQLKVTGASSVVSGSLTASASLDDKNYKLVGALTASYAILKSEVTGTVWYEYGKDVPVADGEVPEIPYISVYGKDGPKFSARGILKAADPDVTWAAAETSYIELQVSYPEFNTGFWDVREQPYTANAALSGADRFNNSCTMPLSVAAVISFKVCDLSHDVKKADVRWIVIGGNGEHIDASLCEFVYNGAAQAPKAIRVLDASYNPSNPVDGTYEFLNVSGAGSDAGTYYAFIIPDGNYFIADGDADFEYIIKPKQITVNWTVGKYVYDGVTEHKPIAVADGTDGIPCTLTVDGYAEAGEWTAEARVSKNFEITSGATCAFTVERMNLSGVTWDFETGDVGEIRHHPDGDYFVWAYDGNTHTPKASLKVMINGVEKEISLIVTGGMSEVGSHYAFATLDSADFDNANFKLETQSLRFDIVRDTVNIVWSDEDADGNIYYDYDGASHAPTAYYTVNGQKIALNVVGSGTDAGTYVAYITDKLDIASGSTHEFTIRAKELTVKWNGLTAEYDGNIKYPEVTFTDGGAADPTALVALVWGKDYVLTGFTDAGSYTSEIIFLNGNYTFAAGTGESTFTVNKKDVNISWRGNGDGTFDWMYDGAAHAPTATADISGVNVFVVGGESAVGEYTATAVADNGNYKLIGATQTFKIKPYEITVDWSGRLETGPDGIAQERFDWEFDGEHAFAPEASFTDWNGNRVSLKVTGGKIYAGDYKATAVLPENCAFAPNESGTKDFKVTKKIVRGVVWTGNVTTDGEGVSTETFEWVFDGKLKHPTAKILSTGEVLAVTGGAVNVGEYTATAVLADSDNYEFEDGVVVTHKFKITPKTDVNILWYGNGGTLGANFNNYVYDGTTIHCPTAKFIDVDGREVTMPVNGGTASAGQFTATVIDVYANYDFRAIKLTQTFEVLKTDISLSWESGYTQTDGEYVYAYTYSGTSRLPFAVNATNSVSFVYVIRDSEGRKTDGAIDAGTYTVEAVPSDPNFKIAVGSGEQPAKVKIVIEKLSVAVQWGDTSFVYNGQAQKPSAWYTDANGQRVELAVSGAQTDVGAGYTATAEPVSAKEKNNYDFINATASFEITQSVSAEYEWIWDEATSTGSWQLKPVSGGYGETGGEGDNEQTQTP